MTTNRRQTVVLCLIVIVFTILFAYLFRSISKMDDKLDAPQYTQMVEAEKTVAEIYEMKSNIDDLVKQSAESENRIDTLYRANEAHENCVALAMLINEPSVLAAEYGRSEETQGNLYKNDKLYAEFYGRLYVPDAKIDVALYYGYQQYICDRLDSANIFTWGIFDGEYIADHSNQEFRKLFSVEVGMLGYIKLENGDIINIKCTEIMNGYNKGYAITDENGNSELDADFIMYTCRNGWRNIRLCLWKIY